MTVTPIHGHTPIQGHIAGVAARQRHRASVTTAAGSDHPEWSLTVDIHVSGTADPAILDLVQDLQRLLDRGTNPPAADRRVVRIDPAGRTLTIGGRPVALSRLEFNLLLFLAENPGRVFSRERLLAEVWGEERSGARTVDVHVRRIRAKAVDLPLITTVRTIGYRLAPDARVHVVRS